MKIIRRLACEYKAMYKPDRRTLAKDTCRIAGTAVIAAIVLKITDAGFAALLGTIL